MRWGWIVGGVALTLLLAFGVSWPEPDVAGAPGVTGQPDVPGDPDACESAEACRITFSAHLLLVKEPGFAASAKALTRGCELYGDGSACRLLAWWVNRGRIKGDELALERRACELGDAIGCRQFGGAFDASIRPPLTASPDDLALILKGCKAGDAFTCNTLLSAVSDSSRLDRMDTACTAGEAIACLVVEGKRVIYSDALAAGEALRSACDEGQAWGCILVAENGMARRPEDPDALHYYARACDAGAALGCRNGGAFAYAKDQNAEGQRLFQRGCDISGEPDLCWRAERGDKRIRFSQTMLDNLVADCLYGNAKTCDFLAFWIGEFADRFKAESAWPLNANSVYALEAMALQAN